MTDRTERKVNRPQKIALVAFGLSFVMTLVCSILSPIDCLVWFLIGTVSGCAVMGFYSMFEIATIRRNHL